MSWWVPLELDQYQHVISSVHAIAKQSANSLKFKITNNPIIIIVLSGWLFCDCKLKLACLHAFPVPWTNPRIVPFISSNPKVDHAHSGPHPWTKSARCAPALWTLRPQDPSPEIWIVIWINRAWQKRCPIAQGLVDNPLYLNGGGTFTHNPLQT